MYIADFYEIHKDNIFFKYQIYFKYIKKFFIIKNKFFILFYLEEERFELSDNFLSAVFKTVALSLSATPPDYTYLISISYL